ncbi:MAG: TfoX/Sxy family protein [Chloroflexi bacterium]|nr:TfoX/Sxy family protein [Chloroflexota bacterium]
MKWKKVSPELNKFLDETMSAFPADRRPMFGASTFFVNGNMFVGIHEDRIIVRLSEADQKEILSLYRDVTPFEPMEGRVMKEYVTLPESVYRQPQVLKDWLSRSYQYALSLKPKATPARNRKR